VLEWSWVGRVAHQNSENGPTTRSRVRPQRRWVDDMKEEVRGSWIQITQD